MRFREIFRERKRSSVFVNGLSLFYKDFNLIISLNFIMLDDQNDKYSKSIYKVQTQRDERMRVTLITSHSQQK